jgi:hypothetical protein
MDRLTPGKKTVQHSTISVPSSEFKSNQKRRNNSKRKSYL